MKKLYKSSNYRRIRILERIIKHEKPDSVKRMLALIGLRQFATMKMVRF